MNIKHSSILAFLLLLSLDNKLFAQNNSVSDLFLIDTHSFIDSIYESRRIGSDNKIYILTCECIDSIRQRKKIELTYIQNQNEFKRSVLTYYFNYKNDFIITHKVSLEECPELLKLNLDEYKIQSDLEYKVVQVLYPNILGEIFSEKWQLIIYFDNNNYRSVMHRGSKQDIIVIQEKKIE